MEAEGTLTIIRTSPDDMKDRQIYLRLDDKDFGKLLYGQTLERSIPQGHHLLRADNTWHKKRVEFDVGPGENVRFQVINRLGFFTWFLVMWLGVGPLYLTIERLPPE